MSGLILRFGLPQERQALEDLQRRSSLVYEAYREALLAHPGAIHLPSSQLEARQVRVVQEGDQVLGFTAVLPRDAGGCELDGLFVEPDRWKQGLGRALMQDAFALATARGDWIMHVMANPHAEGFYAKLGFVRTGTVQTQFGIGSQMQRNLA